ncbi:MAG: MotA/TolQ/ExbB proton channel family protein [Sphingomonadales bacterium]
MPMHQDLSLWTLFWQASPVVKGVILLLVLLSVICWSVIIEKAIRLTGLRKQLKQLRQAAASGATTGVTGIGRVILDAGHGEAADRISDETRTELRDRIERAMRLALASELRKVEPGLPFLATVGSAAPFIGLFGTVWGIMHSFAGIASAQNVSLAVVAPGIAEALFATAIGLAAAIPAVLGYNKLAIDLGRVGQEVNTEIVAIAKGLIRSEAPPALRRTA